MRGGSPLALEDHRPARRPAPDPPLAAARLGGDDRARRRQGGDLAARAGHERGGGQRAAQPAAGERGHRPVAEGGLSPPPAARERAAPVLLRVGIEAVERHPLASEHRLAADARRQQVRMPVLRQPRGGLGGAEPAERPPRPPHATLEHGLEPGVLAEVEHHAPLGPAQHSRLAVEGGDAEPVRVRPCARRVRPAHEAAGVRGQRDRRPRAVRRLADAAQRDDRAAGGRVGEAPVVALHRDAVGAARVAERRIRPGTPIRGEEAQRSISACWSGMPKRASASASPSSSR